MWATVASAFKIALRYMDFLQLLFFSSVVSLAVLFFILLIQRRVYLLAGCGPGDYARSALFGFLSPFLYYTVLFKAYSLLPAQEAQPLNYTWPVMLALLSIPLLKQPIGLRAIGAVLISFAGVLVISTRGNVLGLRFTNSAGVLLALGSSVIWALFWICNLRDRRDVVARLFLNFVFGAIYTFVAVVSFSSITLSVPLAVFGAVYVGFFEMGLTFIVWSMALAKSRTTAQVGNLVYLAPFASLLVIRVAVGEKILVSTAVGLILIVAGILVQRSGRGPHPPDSGDSVVD
jgi:drug/metabolite transporter (DMT)-like permease